MEDFWSCVSEKSIHESGEGELYGMGGLYRETDDLPSIEVDDGGDIHEPSLKRDVREVGTPDVVFIHWAGSHQEVRVDHLDIRCSVPFLASPAVCFDAEDVHHSLHLLAVHYEMDSETS